MNILGEYTYLTMTFGLYRTWLYQIMIIAEMVIFKILYLYKYSNIAVMNEYFLTNFVTLFNFFAEHPPFSEFGTIFGLYQNFVRIFLKKKPIFVKTENLAIFSIKSHFSFFELEPNLAPNSAKKLKMFRHFTSII